MEFVVAVDVEVVCLPLSLLDGFHLDSRLVWLLHRSRSRPVVQFRSPLIGLIPGKCSSGTARMLALEMNGSRYKRACIHRSLHMRSSALNIATGWP